MAGGRRFSYYERLSASDKAIYRKSDEITRVALPDPVALAPLTKALELALFSGKRLAVAKASNALSDAMLDQLGAPRVKLTVRETRPELGEGAELHGLYTFANEEEETPAKIELWMRTRAQEKVVRFRTFLRTMLHEVCHHLDMTLLDLGDSFHTEGFFRRESSLVRQLVGTASASPSRPRSPLPAPLGGSLPLLPSDLPARPRSGLAREDACDERAAPRPRRKRAIVATPEVEAPAAPEKKQLKLF